MSEWSGAAAGGAGGATQGAAVGYQVGGGAGAAIGGAIGLGVGGVSGYLGGKGAKKRKKKQEQARNRYLAALGEYEQKRLGNIEGQVADAQRGMADQTRIDDDYYRQMVGDQSAGFINDQVNAQAALSAVGPKPVLGGPLGAQYADEMVARNQVALRPMATSQAILSQASAQDAVDRDRALRSAALMPDALYKSQLRGLSNAKNEQAIMRASQAYGINRDKADNAGSEHMMYGAMLNQLMQMGGQVGSSYASNKKDQARHDDYVAALKSGGKQ